MDDRELAKLLTQAGEDPNSFIGTSSQMNADGTVTVTGRRGSVTAIAQTAFRSGAWSVKRVGNTWYAWSTNAPIIETESRQVRRSSPQKPKESLPVNYVILFDFDLADANFPEQNFKFIENLFLRFFSSKVKHIYTFSDSPGDGIPAKFYPYPILDFLRTKITVKEVTISQLNTVDSVFYLPLTISNVFTRPNPFIDVSELTISAINRIAKKHGVILQGEHQSAFNLVNHFLMNSFYGPAHPDYSYVFPFGIEYRESSLPSSATLPYKFYDNKFGKLLFKGIESQEIKTDLSAAIPMDVIPEKERLAFFDHESKRYISVVGWRAK